MRGEGAGNKVGAHANMPGTSDTRLSGYRWVSPGKSLPWTYAKGSGTAVLPSGFVGQGPELPADVDQMRWPARSTELKPC
jgi:hypothetical protein